MQQQKALEAIGEALKMQYERWQPRVRFFQHTRVYLKSFVLLNQYWFRVFILVFRLCFLKGSLQELP